jgi:hypothetical protein
VVRRNLENTSPTLLTAGVPDGNAKQEGDNGR